ncbi:hypothetical protein [Tolypothrix sp. VBCCA 56010]|uniref:hypothetical protein n=1 Tax=Tolypothrix sp. VBCCA 56010 TaxID=3137731 RepID=UPI003D7E4BF2
MRRGHWALGIKKAAFRDGRINRILSIPHARCPMPHAPLATITHYLLLNKDGGHCLPSLFIV